MPTLGFEDHETAKALPVTFSYPLYGTNIDDAIGVTAGEPDPYDVQQGLCNNCWLVCGMMLAAHNYKQDLMDAIDDHGDGTFTVRLWAPTMKYKGRQTAYRVDNRFYVHNGSERARGTAHYAHSPTAERAESALWPMVLEKAIACHLSAARDDEASYSYVDASAKAAKKYGVPVATAGSVVLMLNGGKCSLRARKSNTASFPGYPGWEKIWGAMDKGIAKGVTVGTLGLKKDEGQGRLIGNHMYLVLSTGQDDDGKYIKCLNPHNRDDVGRKRKVKDILRQATLGIDADGRQFKVYGEEFMDFFASFSIMN